MGENTLLLLVRLHAKSWLCHLSGSLIKAFLANGPFNYSRFLYSDQILVPDNLHSLSGFIKKISKTRNLLKDEVVFLIYINQLKINEITKAFHLPLKFTIGEPLVKILHTDKEKGQLS